ncbi:MAG: serine/threonine-protein kinase [Gallionella sp.]
MNNIGKYKIIRKLGEGGTSNVLLAIDSFNSQQVALKLMDLNSIRDKATAKAHKKLLQVEASLVGKLQHPHIVQMLDAVITDDLSYIVMEYVDGGSLEQYADSGRLLPIATVADIMFKCCKALEYAQDQGVIHRDIKPANILMHGKGEIKISDFGAAMVLDGDSTMVVGVGSPTYMSPEQITGEKLTHQTDIYSLGVTMYKLLTGKSPFQATTRHGLFHQIVNSEQTPAGVHRPDIPGKLDSIIQRAMRRDLSRRYQTWREFAADLSSFLNLNDNGQEVIFDAEKFDAMRRTSFFEKFSDVELWEVLHLSKWHKVRKGASILNAGDMGNTFFILADGVAKVLRNGNLVDFLHKGDCFGEIKRLPDSDYLRTTGVEAGTDCILFEVDLDVLEKASLECRYQFNEAFLHILLRRLNSANTRISKLLGAKEYYGVPVKPV